jgi:hypothetical protein
MFTTRMKSVCRQYFATTKQVRTRKNTEKVRSEPNEMVATF